MQSLLLEGQSGGRGSARPGLPFPTEAPQGAAATVATPVVASRPESGLVVHTQSRTSRVLGMPSAAASAPARSCRLLHRLHQQRLGHNISKMLKELQTPDALWPRFNTCAPGSLVQVFFFGKVMETEVLMHHWTGLECLLCKSVL